MQKTCLCIINTQNLFFNAVWGLRDDETDSLSIVILCLLSWKHKDRAEM